MIDLPLGAYRHYKGTLYEVLGVGKHSETLEEFVVYRDVEMSEKLWVRPLAMFVGTVEVAGKVAARFAKVNE